MEKILTQQLGPYAETVPGSTSAGWIPPEGNRLFTPQQDIIIVGVDMSAHFEDYNSSLVAAGNDTAAMKAQLSIASGVDVPGLICELDLAVGTTLQGGLTNSGPTFVPSANKFMQHQADKGQLIPENTDIGVWVYRVNNTGNDCLFQAMFIVHYVLRKTSNISRS